MARQTTLKAPFPWFGDAMAYAKAHVAAGVLRVDDDGSIWRCARNVCGTWRPSTPRRAENVGNKGYFRVSLHVPETRRLAIVMAHCLVYEVLVGPIPDGLEINHKDLVKTNNRPDNLEPITGAGNIQHSYANGRTRPWSQTKGDWRPGRPVLAEEAKQRATSMRLAGEPLKAIASALGISISYAHRITSGEFTQ